MNVSDRFIARLARNDDLYIPWMIFIDWAYKDGLNDSEIVRGIQQEFVLDKSNAEAVLRLYKRGKRSPSSHKKNPVLKDWSQEFKHYFSQPEKLALCKYGHILLAKNYSSSGAAEELANKFGLNASFAKWLIQEKCQKDNPVKIYDSILEIRAKKGKDSLWPSEHFVHKFRSRSKGEIIGNSDGSLTIRSKSGKRLWKNFRY